MLLVAIQNCDTQTKIQRQRLMPFKLAVDLVETVPQWADIHQSMHPSHGIGTDHGPFQPPFPEAGCGDGFQGIEAAQVRPDHRQGGFEDERGGRPRLRSLVGNLVEHLAGKVKHLLGIANQTVEQALRVPAISSPACASIRVRRLLR